MIANHIVRQQSKVVAGVGRYCWGRQRQQLARRNYASSSIAAATTIMTDGTTSCSATPIIGSSRQNKVVIPSCCYSSNRLILPPTASLNVQSSHQQQQQQHQQQTRHLSLNEHHQGLDSSLLVPPPLIESSTFDDPAVREYIFEYAKQPSTSVSLQALMRTGKGEYLHKTFGEDVMVGEKNHAATELVLVQVASFLRRELPIRLAHRIKDLAETVPILAEMKSIQAVRDLYVMSFLELVHFDFPIKTASQEEAFASLVENIYDRHSSVLVQMARGAYEFRDAIRSERGNARLELKNESNEFLDRFYLCRIGIRVLIGQYLALRQPPVESYVGIICSKTSPYEIVKRAIDDAAFMCTRKYGDAPEVIMSGRLDLTFPYVPTHLHYIMLELIKNCMRATVEWHGVDGDFPPIKVVIADGAENEDVVIKVSDEGGGIPRSNMEKIWSYLFTTADPTIQEGMVGTSPNGGGGQHQQQNHVDHGLDAPLAGLGYGLPISRSYCRYFGGDLSIMSMEGWGTDAFVYLTRLGNTREPVPV